MAEERIDNAYVLNLLKQQSASKVAVELTNLSVCSNKSIKSLDLKIRNLKAKHDRLKRNGKPTGKATFKNFLQELFSFPVVNEEIPRPRLVSETWRRVPPKIKIEFSITD